MSYILDALKKADAERERGHVPGLHSHPAPLALEPEPSRPPLATVAWVLAALLGILVVLLAWRLVVPAEAPAASVPDRSPVVRSEEAPFTTPTSAPPAIPDQAKMASTAAPRIETSKRARSAPRQATASVPLSGTPGGGEPAQRVYAFSDLPEGVRRALPQLTVGGAMYSETPTNRMLIINSQVFHEGDHPVPELTLEEIRLKSAVFRFKGYRYTMAY